MQLVYSAVSGTGTVSEDDTAVSAAMLAPGHVAEETGAEDDDSSGCRGMATSGVIE